MHKILIASTAHQNSDDMVYYRYARLFKDCGYEVVLVTMKSDVDHDKDIVYFDMPFIQNPIRRMSVLPRYIEKAIRDLKEDDYFLFFSIDLNNIAINASKRGIKVIKIFAEDYSRKAYSREWIPRMLRGLVSKYVYHSEIKTSKRCYLSVFVDSATEAAYNHGEINSCVVPNYPIDIGLSYRERHFDQNNTIKMVYVGGISEIRGIYFILSMAERLKTKVSIDLYGKTDEIALLDNIMKCKRVNYRGTILYDEVLNRLNEYDIGLAVFKPCYGFDYAGENTTKIFEYMQAGLPIITSDIGSLKDIVEKQTKCGIAIDYSDFDKAITIIDAFLSDPSRLKRCSVNGRTAFQNSRNWEAASKLLLNKMQQTGYH